jgi:hypothetical protein
VVGAGHGMAAVVACLVAAVLCLAAAVHGMVAGRHGWRHGLVAAVLALGQPRVEAKVDVPGGAGLVRKRQKYSRCTTQQCRYTIDVAAAV